MGVNLDKKLGISRFKIQTLGCRFLGAIVGSIAFAQSCTGFAGCRWSYLGFWAFVSMAGALLETLKGQEEDMWRVKKGACEGKKGKRGCMGIVGWYVMYCVVVD